MTNPVEHDQSFYQELCAEDELGSVIRAHLHVEQSLNSLLSTQIPYSKELDSLNLDYSSLVHLSLAMGLPKDYKSPLLNLGSIRNKFAHKKNYKLLKSDSNNFYKSFAAKDKEIIQEGYAAIKSLKVKWANLPPKDVFVLCTLTINNVLLCAIEEW